MASEVAIKVALDTQRFLCCSLCLVTAKPLPLPQLNGHLWGQLPRVAKEAAREAVGGGTDAAPNGQWVICEYLLTFI